MGRWPEPIRWASWGLTIQSLSTNTVLCQGWALRVQGHGKHKLLVQLRERIQRAQVCGDARLGGRGLGNLLYLA